MPPCRLEHLAYSIFEDIFDPSQCYDGLRVASGPSTVDPTGLPLEASVILLLDPTGDTLSIRTRSQSTPWAFLSNLEASIILLSEHLSQSTFDSEGNFKSQLRRIAGSAWSFDSRPRWFSPRSLGHSTVGPNGRYPRHPNNICCPMKAGAPSLLYIRRQPRLKSML